MYAWSLHTRSTKGGIDHRRVYIVLYYSMHVPLHKLHEKAIPTANETSTGSVAAVATAAVVVASRAVTTQDEQGFSENSHHMQSLP